MPSLVVFDQGLYIADQYISRNAVVPPGLNKVRMVGNLTLLDKQDPTVLFHIEIEVSDDDGASYHSYAGFGFKGGLFIDKNGEINPDPYVSVDAAPIVGKRVQAVLDVGVLNPGDPVTGRPVIMAITLTTL